MEVELNNLIDKIKKEGVEQAENNAKALTREAQGKAKKIVADAQRRKDEIIKEAEVQTQNFKKSAEKALKQAARDVLLTLRERVTEFYYRIVKEKVSESLTPEVLKEIIIKTIGNFRKDNILDIEVLLSKADKVKLEKSLLSALRREAKKHFSIMDSANVEKGFRIGEKGQDSYFDFTDEAITEAFKRYLNPKLLEILDIDLGLGHDKGNGE